MRVAGLTLLLATVLLLRPCVLGAQVTYSGCRASTPGRWTCEDAKGVTTYCRTNASNGFDCDTPGGGTMYCTQYVRGSLDCMTIPGPRRQQRRSNESGCDGEANNPVSAVLCSLAESMDRREKERATAIAEQRRAAVQRFVDSAEAAQRIRREQRQVAESRKLDSLRLELYLDRGVEVARHLGDSASLGLFTEIWSAYSKEAVTTMLKLYEVNPLAGSDAIRDQLLPVVSRHGEFVQRWSDRFYNVVRGFADSARIPVASRGVLVDSAWAQYFRDTTLSIGDGEAAIRERIDAALWRHACRLPPPARPSGKRAECKR